MDLSKWFAIEDEILDSNYSENVIDTTITNGNLTTPRGTWGVGTGDTPSVLNSSDATAASVTPLKSGNRITINIGTNNDNAVNYGRKGDFVQFSGYSKVFQLTENISDNASPVNTVSQAAGDHIITLSLNGSIPASLNSNTGLADDAVVVFGRNVVFKLQIKERPEPEFSEIDIVNYGSASFEEVLI